MIKFGVFCMQTGEHREATSAHDAINLWESAPRTVGTWCLVIDGEIKETQEEIAEKVGILPSQQTEAHDEIY